MTRVVVALLSLALLAQFVAEAQPAGKVWRLGYLSIHPPTSAPAVEARRLLSEALRERGYVDRENLAIEWRWAEGRMEHLPRLAAELVRFGVDVIVVGGNAEAVATKAATSVIPIVVTGMNNPVETGLVESMARPGGNVTGTTYNPPEIAGKMVEVLREAAPSVSRLTVIWNPWSPGMRVYQPHADDAARALGISMRYLDVQRPGEPAWLLDEVTRGRPDALLIVADGVVASYESQLLDTAARQRLPTIYSVRSPVYRGGLLYYGVNRQEVFSRAVNHIDRILRGAKPSSLPIEQPTKFELVVNLKTAKALGLTIPQSVLLRADEVIQ